MPSFDLVFEGGGAKGTAFAGALGTFYGRGCEHRRLIGTSAGAITAALVAAGYSPKEMLVAVNEKEADGKTPRFVSFMDAPEEGSFADAVVNDSLSMRTLQAIDLPLIPEVLEAKIDRMIMGRLMKLRGYRQLFSLIERGGLYSGATFRAWLEEKLDAKKLAGLTLAEFHAKTEVDLSLAATDTTAGELRILNHRTTPNCPVSWAVRISMSIPFVWQEVVWKRAWGGYLGERITGNVFVDGGVLSNFPLDLLISTEPHVLDIMGHDIVQDEVPNLGFLIDETLEVENAPHRSDTEEEDDEHDDDDEDETGDERASRFKMIRRVKRLVDTMTSASNQRTIGDHEDEIYRVPAKGYGTTEFGMSDERVSALVKSAEVHTTKHLEGRLGDK